MQQKHLRIMQEAAIIAAKTILEHKHNGFSVSTKASPSDLLTKADIAAQAVITEHLNKYFPDYDLMGEEGKKDTDLKETHRWVVDPIDGTMHLVLGSPMWGISIALEKISPTGSPNDNKVIAGLLYFPETGDMYTALSGRNGKSYKIFLPRYRDEDEGMPSIKDLDTARTKRLKVDKTIPIEGHFVVVGGNVIDNPTLGTRIQSFANMGCQILKLNATAWILAQIAEGKGWSYAHSGGIHAWDADAGVLIARKAGASVEYTRSPDAAGEVSVFASSSAKTLAQITECFFHYDPDLQQKIHHQRLKQQRKSLEAPERALILGHRGASAYEKDNTEASFARAAADGADGFELDVMVTSDNKIIIKHDLAIEDTPVQEMSYAEIKSKNPDILEFSEFLDLVTSLEKQYNRSLHILIEIKDVDASKKVIKTLKDKGFTKEKRAKNITIGAFSEHSMKAVHLAMKNQNIKTIETSWMEAGVWGKPEELAARAISIGCDGVHLCWESRAPSPDGLISRNFIKELHAYGLKVALWHEERPEIIKKMLEARVDYICTNDPKLVEGLVTNLD